MARSREGLAYDEFDSHGAIEEPADLWVLFNEEPMRFDLSDPRVYEAIVEGRAVLMGSVDIGSKDYPPLQVLQEAQIAVGIDPGVEITDTSVYRRWENSQISGFAEGDEMVKPSLDERRAAQARKRQEEQGGEGEGHTLSDLQSNAVEEERNIGSGEEGGVMPEDEDKRMVDSEPTSDYKPNLLQRLGLHHIAARK